MKSVVSKSNPRVLILSTNSDEAGAPVHVHSVISSLMHRVDFIAVFGEDGPIAEKIRKLGISVEIVPEMKSAINPTLDFAAFCSISEHIKKYKPNLIHAHSSKAGMLGRMISFRYKLPCIYTVHGWGWRGLGLSKGILVFLIEKIFSIIPRTSLIYVSNSVEKEAIGRLFLPPKKGVVIHNGVSDLLTKEKQRSDCEPLKIIMPARVSSAKDHITLLKAFEKIKFPSQLLLCGAGTDSIEFINTANMIAPKRFRDIFFLGSRSDVPELLVGADIFALISNFEALPISIIEAMSAAKAIIASNVGGVTELIDDGLNGLCVERNNYKDVLAAMNKFSDSSFRKNCGQKARNKYVLNFTLKTMADKIFSRYIFLLNECQ